MCTAFTHAFVGLAVGRAWFPGPMPRRFWLLAPACSALPDLDVGLHAYGVAYGDLWGHRGMAHSLLFAAAISITVVTAFLRRDAPPLSRRWINLVAFFFVIVASHGFIDAFTDGGLGIAFFSPFDQTRYFMPWTPILVPHFGLSAVFTEYGGRVLLSELKYVCIPVGVLSLGTYLIRRRPSGRPTPDAGA